MASISKILGQANPAAVLTDLYTVPAGGVSFLSLNVCNRSVFAESYRVSVALAGAADHVKQYLEYDKVLAANNSEVITGIALKAGDKLRIYASASTVSFTAMGTETI